jgi:hypothetical protein
LTWPNGDGPQGEVGHGKRAGKPALVAGAAVAVAVTVAAGAGAGEGAGQARNGFGTCCAWREEEADSKLKCFRCCLSSTHTLEDLYDSHPSPLRKGPPPHSLGSDLKKVCPSAHGGGGGGVRRARFHRKHTQCSLGEGCGNVKRSYVHVNSGTCLSRRVV